MSQTGQHARQLSLAAYHMQKLDDAIDSVVFCAGVVNNAKAYPGTTDEQKVKQLVEAVYRLYDIQQKGK